MRVWSTWAGDPAPGRRYWMNLIDAAQPARTRIADEAPATQGEPDSAGDAPGRPVGRLVIELSDPFDLEVHRPIEVAAPPGGLLPVLPPYVSREHDLRLEEVMARAVSGRSAVAVLVGGSSTGKTRACWETVHRLPPGWRLWHPISPGRPEAVLESLGRVGPRTVIWLNEAQHYLLTPTGPLGERVAAGVRELVRDPARGPVLVLGTLWPEYWSVLTTAPPPDQQVDPHAQARALLTGGTGITVPGAFTGTALNDLRAAATGDPRLAHACAQAEDGRITQFLAGAPALLERHRNAPPAATALIEAAMDVRRLGHGPALPRSLLETAAPAHLDDHEWQMLEDDWLEQSLTYTGTACRGVPGPLTLIRPRPGQAPYGQPHYRLADYLEQYGRTTRWNLSVPAEIWDALVDHARAEHLSDLADEAEHRSLDRYALMLYAAAASETGSAYAWSNVGRLTARVAWSGPAITAYQHVVEAEDATDEALLGAGRALQSMGKAEEALACYQRILNSTEGTAPSPLTTSNAAELLMEVMGTQEAIGWLQDRAKAGASVALTRAAWWLEKEGRVDEALVWLRECAEAGTPGAWSTMGDLLRGTGRPEEAISAYQRAGEAGTPDAWPRAGTLLSRAGRKDEAITAYRHAGEAGLAKAWMSVGRLLEETGRVDEAISAYQHAAQTGCPDGLDHAARVLDEQGRLEEALAWLQDRARAGTPTTAWSLAGELLHRAGRVDEAITSFQHAGAAGLGYAWESAGELLEETGRIEEAITAYQHAAKNRTDKTRRRGLQARHRIRNVCTRMREAGQTRQLFVWLQAYAETGDHHALRETAAQMREAGRTEELHAWVRSCTEASIPLNPPDQVAAVLEEAGGVEEAFAWLQARAETGDTDAQDVAVELLTAKGMREQALTWLHTRAETGDHHALYQQAEVLEQAGEAEEAINLFLRAAETGDHHDGPGSLPARQRAKSLLEETDKAEDAARLHWYGLEPGGLIAGPWSTDPSYFSPP
ncbi:tetratricopeptide repeat protein [Actinomadura scrupuli]|uniref:tetratricopeptide repeat protein n=1 Tax=Actinomadura scrupuli TaxID=559629 RepID=UPI003D95CAE2